MGNIILWLAHNIMLKSEAKGRKLNVNYLVRSGMGVNERIQLEIPLRFSFFGVLGPVAEYYG